MKNSHKKINNYKSDKRNTEDRRDFGPPAKFPLVDSDGNVVLKDRRVRPDRRITNIQVTENYIKTNKK